MSELTNVDTLELLAELTHLNRVARGTDGKDELRAWLLDYAWSGTKEQQAAEVECILTQDRWQHVAAHAEHLRAQLNDPDDQFEQRQARGMAVSALYECHDGPHIDTCPMWRPEGSR